MSRTKQSCLHRFVRGAHGLTAVAARDLRAGDRMCFVPTSLTLGAAQVRVRVSVCVCAYAYIHIYIYIYVYVYIYMYIYTHI